MPKLLGTYEMELHPILTPSFLRQFARVIDIGCAEGFYLAGIGHMLRARNHPLPELVGYDLDPVATERARELLALNCLQSDKIFTLEFLPSGMIASTDLLICDIEGAEEELLCPKTYPGLARASIIAEVHDQPSETRRLALLRSRFARTHDILVILRRSRSVTDFPALRWPRIPIERKLAWMDERRRYGNAWIKMTPKAEQVKDARDN